LFILNQKANGFLSLLQFGVRSHKLDLGGNEDVDMCYWGEAYLVAIKDAIAEFHEVFSQTSIQEKANAFSEHLHANQTTIVCKI
jgi:hypothetical protein